MTRGPESESGLEEGSRLEDFSRARLLELEESLQQGVGELLHEHYLAGRYEVVGTWTPDEPYRLDGQGSPFVRTQFEPTGQVIELRICQEEAPELYAIQDELEQLRSRLGLER